MTKGRRDVSISDASRWVFNRIADVYGSRPPYPAPLIDAIARVAGPAGCRVGDIGAGIGHVALPLSERGFEVVAVEPATSMLDRLRTSAESRGLVVNAVHGAAESLPLETASLDAVVIADALHFVNAELAPREIARVLRPDGALAVVACELGDTPFMRRLDLIIQEATQRRPRVAPALDQLFGIVGIPSPVTQRFADETPVERAELESILRSVSFIGPAMSPERFEAFRRRVHALGDPPVWARTFTLQAGRRSRAR